MTNKIIAVDFGGTNIRVALAEPDGTLVKVDRVSTEAHLGLDHVLARIETVIRGVAGDAWSQVSGVGMIAPGPLNPWEGIIIQAPNLPGWEDVPLKAIFEKSLERPVQIGNDANLAALAEQRFGVAKGLKDLIYLTVSTGIGSGIIVDNRMLLGAEGLGGEVGHMVAKPHGPLCNCGTHGCLEAVASGTGIAREARRRITPKQGQLMVEMAGNVEAVTAVHVGRAALAGDALAVTIIKEAAEWIGFGIISLMRIFNPKMIIIGGGVSQLGNLFFEPINTTIQTNLIEDYWRSCPVVPVSLGDDVGLLGAVALVGNQG